MIIKTKIVNRTELKHLIFWALVGFTQSNGGSSERKMPKIFAKYMKEIGMKRGEMPSLGIQSKAMLSPRTKEMVVKELKTIFPKTNF